jgi:hypothetical protein
MEFRNQAGPPDRENLAQVPLAETPDGERVVPAVAEHDPDRVRSFPQRVRHVVHTVKRPFRIIGPTGIEYVIPYPLTVEARLVVAQARHIEPGADRAGLDFEPLAKKRSGIVLIERLGRLRARLAIPDPLRLPVLLVQAPHFPEGRRTEIRRTARTVEDPDLPVHPLCGGQGFSQVLDLDRTGRRSPPGVPQIALVFFQEIPTPRGQNLIPGLNRAPGVRLDLPAEPRLGHIHPKRVHSKFAPQPRGPQVSLRVRFRGACIEGHTQTRPPQNSQKQSPYLSLPHLSFLPFSFGSGPNHFSPSRKSFQKERIFA